MDNPYSPPLVHDPAIALTAVPDAKVSFRFASILGIATGAYVAVAIYACFNFARIVFGGEPGSVPMPFLAENLYLVFISASGAIIAAGLYARTKPSTFSSQKLAAVALGGAACLLAAEGNVFSAFLPITPLHFGHPDNLAKRSVLLCLFMCLMMGVRIRKRRLIIVSLVGYIAWQLLHEIASSMPIYDWTKHRSWTNHPTWCVVAAPQIWCMLTPRRFG